MCRLPLSLRFCALRSNLNSLKNLTNNCKYLIIEESVGGETLNIERLVCQNALQLLVNKNDPTLFNNPETFEKSLLEGGASKSNELTVIKQSLIHRIPWEVRKQANNLTLSFVKELSNSFAGKANITLEMADWAVDAWITVLNLKKIQEKPTATTNQPPTPNNQISVPNQQKNLPQAVKKTDTDMPTTVAFEKIKGRLGIVFGEDALGDVKVFNTWYDQASSEESSSMSVTPVKLETAPVKPFKTAPKRKKDKFEAIKKAPATGNTVSNKAAPSVAEHNGNVANSGFNQAEYKPGKMEQQAYDLLKKGSAFANQALKILAPIAVGGSVLACRKMGEVYYKGYGVMQNYQAAEAWLKLSAEKGDAESLYYLGTMYQFGMGVKKDLPTAKQFFERAVKLGYAKAADSLKIMNMGFNL